MTNYFSLTKCSICLFGTYESQFPRTKTIIRAAQLNKYKIIKCHVPFWELLTKNPASFHPKIFIKYSIKLFIIYIKLSIKFLRLKNLDLMIVGYNGYFDMPVAKLLSKIKKVPLVYTPVFPLYETIVEDRQYVSKNSIKSHFIHKIDEIGCQLADFIILETDEYIHYYNKEFNIPKQKFIKIPLGADENNFYPRRFVPKNLHKIKVLFYGKFIPLQGISYIIKAAKILEKYKNITFEIIGSGQLSEKIHTQAEKLKVSNVTFIDWVDFKKLPEHIQNADICLGIFGDTKKAQRGIPIKVYEALSMKKPVITGNSPAAKGVFKNKINAVLCEMANAQSIADSILLLKRDKKLRENIAEEGYRLYQNLFSSSQIADKLKKTVEKVSHKNF